MFTKMYMSSEIIRVQAKTAARNSHLQALQAPMAWGRELYNADYIIQTVEKLKKKYGTNDPYELCSAMHIVLYRKDLQKKLKGFFFYQSRQKSIVVDSNVNQILEKILIAHELGHAILHKEVAMMHGFQEMEMFEGTAKPMEYEANLFAAELLLEDETVLEYLHDRTFFETAHALKIPAALLDFKLTTLLDTDNNPSPAISRRPN